MIFLIIFIICVASTDAYSKYDINEISSTKGYHVQYEIKNEQASVEIYLLDGKKRIDTLIIPNTQGVVYSQVLNYSFFYIVLRQQCGSECDKKCVRILSVKNSQLYTVATYISYIKGDLSHIWAENPGDYSSPNEHQLYEVKMELDGKSPSDYNIILKEKYSYSSKLKPLLNEKWEKHHKLYFNVQNMMFQNTTITLDGTYNVDDPFQISILTSRRSFQKQVLSGIVLEGQQHVFISGNWYEVDSEAKRLARE